MSADRLRRALTELVDALTDYPNGSNSLDQKHFVLVSQPGATMILFTDPNDPPISEIKPIHYRGKIVPIGPATDIEPDRMTRARFDIHGVTRPASPDKIVSLTITIEENEP